jgi:hypothetical protein
VEITHVSCLREILKRLLLVSGISIAAKCREGQGVAEDYGGSCPDTIGIEKRPRWEWFRKDGTKMRFGHFENGKQVVGEWTTYDDKVVKVTTMKSPVDRSLPSLPADKKRRRSGLQVRSRFMNL